MDTGRDNYWWEMEEILFAEGSPVPVPEWPANRNYASGGGATIHDNATFNENATYSVNIPKWFFGVGAALMLGTLGLVISKIVGSITLIFP